MCNYMRQTIYWKNLGIIEAYVYSNNHLSYTNVKQLREPVN